MSCEIVKNILIMFICQFIWKNNLSQHRLDEAMIHKQNSFSMVKLNKNMCYYKCIQIPISVYDRVLVNKWAVEKIAIYRDKLSDPVLWWQGNSSKDRSWTLKDNSNC